MLTDVNLSVTMKAIMSGAVDLATSESRFALPRALSYTDGAGASQANVLWHDKRQIAASGTDDIDLSGALVDALGVAAVYARVKGLMVYAWPANTNNVVVGGAAATQWVGPFGAATHTVALQPGGLLTLATVSAAGWPVVNAASDLLRIANSAGGTVVDFEIAILGASS